MLLMSVRVSIEAETQRVCCQRQLFVPARVWGLALAGTLGLVLASPEDEKSVVSPFPKRNASSCVQPDQA